MQFSKSKFKKMSRASGMTQPEIGDAVGVHYLTVGLWGGNRHRSAPNGCVPSPEHFQRVCEVLGCEPDELLEQPDDSAKESADHREGAKTTGGNSDVVR